MPEIICFGSFELDLETAELRANGRSSRLPEQQFQILRMLLLAEGRVVSREEIRKRLWPNDTVVEFDRSINTAMMKLRIVLGDTGDKSRLIETLPRRGYRLIVRVEQRNLDSPAPGNGLKKPDSLPGQKVSHYRVLEILGGGGMGVVYKALDLKLDRAVALKFLPEEMGEDEKAIARFEREARAVSALDHPNICPIYEFGEQEGRPFLVMPLLEGKNLRDILAERDEDPAAALPLEKSLELSIQIASGLEAAHDKGIIHRDIKPANIFITQRGVAKILDFGIAKLLPAGESSESEAEDSLSVEQSDSRSATVQPLSLTRTGIAVGSAGYMSPEQVRGEKLDVRTDLFSLGLVIYEMVTGLRAFGGDTAVIVQNAILNESPMTPRELNRELPVEVEKIIARALEKNREERYGTAGDILADLRAVANGSAVASLAGITSQPIVGQEPGRGRVDAHNPLKSIWALALALVVLIAALTPLLTRHRSARHIPFQQVEISQFTDAGSENMPAISPDGKYVAYIGYEGTHTSIWIKQLASGQVQIVPPAETTYGGLTFSHDGDLYFTEYDWHDNPRSIQVLRKIPVIGGPAQRLVADVIGPVSQSPDGKQLAFMRYSPATNESTVVVANEDGGGERLIATHPMTNQFLACAWSPDGKTIAMSSKSQAAGTWTLTQVPSTGGTELPISHHRWAWNPVIGGGLAWTSDGRGLVINAVGDHAVPQIQYVSYPEGDVRKITNDLNWYFFVSLTADSRLLATEQAIFSDDVWVMSISQPDSLRKVTSGGRAYGPTWAPDGRIVYGTTEQDGHAVWEIAEDGSNSKPLAIHKEGIWDTDPALSPDGRYLVFESNRTGSPHIWRIDLNGANLKQLSNSPGEAIDGKDVSPDAKWIVYSRTDEPGKGVWRISIDGGDPVRLSSGSARLPALSQDGKKIAYIYQDLKAKPSGGVAVMAFEGGPPIKVFDIYAQRLRWTPDSRSLLFLNHSDKICSFWSQPIAGGRPKHVAQLSTDSGDVQLFDLSKDGKKLVMLRAVGSNHVILIRDVQ